MKASKRDVNRVQTPIHSPSRESDSVSSCQPGWASSYDVGAAKTGIGEYDSPRAQVNTDMCQLMDQSETVFDRLNNASVCAKQLSLFYQSLASIESSYSKSLLKLAQTTTFSSSHTTQACLSALLSSVEARANIHAQLALELQDPLSKDSNDISNQMKKESAQAKTMWIETDKALKCQTASVDKSFQRYSQAIKEAERELALRKEAKTVQKGISKHEKKIADCFKKYHQRRSSYADSVSTHAKLRSDYSKTCSYILANVEATELSRLHKMKASLDVFYKAMNRALVHNAAPINTLFSAIKAINPADDVAQFVLQNVSSSHDKLPPAIELIDIRTDIDEEESVIMGTGGDSQTTNAKSRSNSENNLDHASDSIHLYSVSSAIGQLNLKASLLKPEPKSVPEYQFFKTVYDYSEDQVDVLSFVPGEFIRLEESMSDGWGSGLLNGQRGLFPISYCEKFTPQVCTAICEFKASDIHSDQLSMSVGDAIWILHVSDRHWVWAANNEGLQGNFPSAYCDPAPQIA